MNVLIACEESQEVCKAFRERGHRAFSCDLQECSGGHPEWHIKGDVLPLLNGFCTFQTEDLSTHTHTHNPGISSSRIHHVPTSRFPERDGFRKNREISGSRNHAFSSCTLPLHIVTGLPLKIR